jgi:hypothetical protein
MLEFSYYTKDVRVSNPQSGSKVTLQLSSSGDLQLSSGQEKLTSQLIRTLINDDSPLKDLINQKVSKGKLNSIVTTILKGFRNTQLDTVNGQNATLTGYLLRRKAAGTSENFSQVSNSIIEWKTEDVNVSNDVTYTYGLSKKYDNDSESSFVDIIDITPTAKPIKEVIIGNGGVFIAGDAKITVYTNYNLYYRNTELLNDIETIEVTQDKLEPRKYNVLVTIKTLAGETVTLSARRLNASTLEPV